MFRRVSAAPRSLRSLAALRFGGDKTAGGGDGHGDGDGHGHGHGHHHHFSTRHDQHKVYEGSFSTSEYGGTHNDPKTRDISKLRFGDGGEDWTRPPPLPPAIPVEPVQPMDFNPHIDIWEFPKEVFDPKFPITREDNILGFEEVHEASFEEMAHRYGLRVNAQPRVLYLSVYILIVGNTFYLLWSFYRTMPLHQHWNTYAMAVAADDPPTIDDDDPFLDHWHNPTLRHARRWRTDATCLWKPLIKDNANPTNSWSVKFEHRDPSEWRHMTSSC